MNVTANGEEPQNGSGPLSWIGTAPSMLHVLRSHAMPSRWKAVPGKGLYLRKQPGKDCCCL